MGLVSGLAERGLTLLSDAIVAKGKDVVEKTIGMKIPESAAGLTPEVTAQLRQMEMQHEEKLKALAIEERRNELESEKAAQGEVTERWKADMASDSWLAKNVRPMVLVYILSAYTLFSVASAFSVAIASAYVELLGQWGMLVMTAYFAGRTVEKIVTIKSGSK
jgi:hypothetical protein